MAKLLQQQTAVNVKKMVPEKSVGIQETRISRNQMQVGAVQGNVRDRLRLSTQTQHRWSVEYHMPSEVLHKHLPPLLTTLNLAHHMS